MKEISNAEYHGHEALGSSNLKMILDNALKFKLIKDGELKIEGKALDFGTAFHTYCLEPETFNDVVEVFEAEPPAKIKDLVSSGEGVAVYEGSAKTRGAKDFKEKEAESGKVLLFPAEYEIFQKLKDAKDNRKAIISSKEMDMILKMSKDIMALKGVPEALKISRKELSFFGEIEGVKVKCRPDFMIIKGDNAWVYDLKTTSDEATPDAFIKTSAKFKYFLQEALYREVLRQNGLNVRFFGFVVASKLEYSTASLCSHAEQSVEYGMELVHKAIQKYKYCLEHDEWLEGQFNFVENRFEDVAEVELPRWVYYQY